MGIEKRHMCELNKVYNGYTLWKKIIEKYELTECDYVVIFPHTNDKINSYGIKYLPDYKKYVSAKRIIILSLEENTEDFEQVDAIVHYLTASEIGELLNLYTIYNFSSHIVIMSLTIPEGRCGDKVICRKQMQLEEVVIYGIYGMNL